MAGGNPTLYGYVGDVNGAVDIFGLACSTLDDLRRTAPMRVPKNARMIAQHKSGGYDQVRFRWNRDGFKYEARWHTATPNAPAGTPANWRVSEENQVKALPNHKTTNSFGVVPDHEING